MSYLSRIDVTLLHPWPAPVSLSGSVHLNYFLHVFFRDNRLHAVIDDFFHEFEDVVEFQYVIVTIGESFLVKSLGKFPGHQLTMLYQKNLEFWVIWLLFPGCLI